MIKQFNSSKITCDNWGKLSYTTYCTVLIFGLSKYAIHIKIKTLSMKKLSTIFYPVQLRIKLILIKSPNQIVTFDDLQM